MNDRTNIPPHPQRAHQNLLIAAVLAFAVSSLAACAAPPGLHANMLDRELHQRLDAAFSPGMTLDQVHARLDELSISRNDRLLYDATDPPQLLTRLFVPGGRFLTQDDQTIEWVDTWFVFGGEGRTLSRWYTRRGGQRYFHGEPVFPPPPDQTAYPTRRYPFDPPPPASPPEPQ